MKCTHTPLGIRVCLHRDSLAPIAYGFDCESIILRDGHNMAGTVRKTNHDYIERGDFGL